MLAALFALLPLLSVISAGPILRRADSRLIESGRTGGFCLSVQGGRQAVADGNVSNGTPVVSLRCGVASFWDISPGSGSVVVSGTNYALDIGLDPRNNGDVKVWQSYPAAPQQTWYLTDDNRIAITGGNQCLDQGDNGPQTYQCTTGNTNQVWNVRFNDPPITPSSSPSSTPTSSAVPSASASQTPGGGQQIHPYGDSKLCLTVNSGYAGSGTPVGVANCFGTGGTFDSLQRWDLPTNGAGPVRVHGTDVCLDAGIEPSNGVIMKIWSCGDYPQQTWTYDGNNLKTANNQCLDVKAGSTGICNKPYCTDADTQTWECSTNNNPNQIFTV